MFVERVAAHARTQTLTGDSENSGGEKDEDTRGNLNSFETPKPTKPSSNGPEDKNWTRIDFIVDSGASDSTLPVGVLPNHFMGEPKGYKEFSMADGRVLGYKEFSMADGRVLSIWEKDP